MTSRSTFQATLSGTLDGTVATSLSPLIVGLHDPRYGRAKNNIERGRGTKGYRAGVFIIFITVSQLIMSGSIAYCPV